MVIKAYGVPDSNQHGNVGDIYIDLDTGLTYECTKVKTDTTKLNGYISVKNRPIESPYTWEPMSAIEWVDEIPEGMTTFDPNWSHTSTYNMAALVKSIRIPYGTTTIMGGSFGGAGDNLDPWPNLEHIYIPDTVTEIQGGVFFNCSKLKELTIPGSVKTVGAGMFPSSLEKLTIEAGIEELPGGFLGGAFGLKVLNLPSTLKRIGSGMGCQAPIESLTLPDGLISIGGGGCSFPKITYVSIPGSVQELSGGAFAGCESLVKVDIQEGATGFGDDAFSACTALAEINIPNSVTVIPETAFESNTGLTTINIDAEPDSIAGAPWGAPDTCTINWLR